MIQPDRFTLKATEALQQAGASARERGNPVMNDAHLFLVLLGQEEGVVRPLLQKTGLVVAEIEAEARREVDRLPTQRGGEAAQSMSRELTNALDSAEALSKRLGDSFISTEHLLISLVSTAGTSARESLSARGITEDTLLEALELVRGSHRVTDVEPEGKFKALERYTTDLTEDARAGKLDPVIGRDEEIRRVIQVLSRRTKNNPVLIGEPGVGKTAIAEGLAQRIVNGDVPETLRGKRLVVLDIAQMVAGAKYRGEFEDRLKSVLKEIKEKEGEFVVFIDELHTIVGAGAAEGSIDASNMLKPPLARGELRVVGATTLDEFRKHIEKDKALERRFQPVFVGEPTVEDTVGILRGLKERYEVHHGVRITDAALVSAATLSNRYIGDRFLPDKAIDLIDEAASRLRIAIDSLPQEIDEVERRLIQLRIEEEALSREKDAASGERLSGVKREIAELQEKSQGMKAQWQAEKAAISILQEKKVSLEAARLEAEQATRSGDLQKAAEITYGKIPVLEKEIAADDERLEQVQANAKYLKEEVQAEDIAEIVARWTGIPVSRMMETERERLTRLEGELEKRVVGQREAVEAVANAVRRTRAGLQDPNRPVGSFIFLGPTGVGKTETGRALAEFLFDDERAMVRLDMSEYMEKHAVARMIGAPPGYVGYEEGGQLTEAVRRRPYSVILFDEIEKAHPDVFNVLLQILDDGRLTDSQGRTVDFRNTVIIMTSNVGSHAILEHAGANPQLVTDQVMEALKLTFKPEFLNRVDDIVVYRTLDKGVLGIIVENLLKEISGLLEDRGMSIKVSAEARAALLEEGFDPVYGARPLKRVIQRRIQNPVALKLLQGEFPEGCEILVGFVNGEMTFEGHVAPAPGAIGANGA